MIDADPAAHEAPDIETSSAQYARRFSGPAGRYMLQVQAQAATEILCDLPPGAVLDMGGAHGQLIDPLSQLGWRVTVHGTDEVCCRNLRDLHGQHSVTFVQGSLFAVPLPDRSFDVVIAVRLLSHVTQWPRLLAEMCRLARRAVVVDYPSKSGMNALTPLLFGVKKSLEGNTRTYANFSRRELCDEFAKQQFRFAREIKQFALPMLVHRLTGAPAPLQAAERAFRASGLTSYIGSPALLRVDRVARES